MFWESINTFLISTVVFLLNSLITIYMHPSVHIMEALFDVNEEHHHLNLVFSMINHSNSFGLHSLLYPSSGTVSSDKSLTATINTFKWASWLFVWKINCSTSNTFTRASLLANVSNSSALLSHKDFMTICKPQNCEWDLSQNKCGSLYQAANDIMISLKRYSLAGAHFLWIPTSV